MASICTISMWRSTHRLLGAVPPDPVARLSPGAAECRRRLDGHSCSKKRQLRDHHADHQRD
jgi:hypothetical protein